MANNLADFGLNVYKQKLHGVVRPLSLKTDVIKKRCVFAVCGLRLWDPVTSVLQEPCVRYPSRIFEEEQLEPAEDRCARE